MRQGNKLYEALATALHKARPQDVDAQNRPPHYMQGRDDEWRIACHTVCDALENLNPAFKRELFLDWCQFGGRVTAGRQPKDN